MTILGPSAGYIYAYGVMDPSWGPAFVHTPRYASSEPVLHASSETDPDTFFEPVLHASSETDSDTFFEPDSYAFSESDLHLSSGIVFPASAGPVLHTPPEPFPHASPEPMSGREVTSRLLISKLEPIKEALCICDKTHSCKEQNGLTVPTRLLDVGRVGNDEVRVITCSEEVELVRRPPAAYAALSYCWGTCPALKSTQSNLASRKRGFSTSNMPLTLRDAVRVTRDLGLHYLWVDALCILQDCKEDWQRESERMAEVYGHAFVTIFAFGARDCEGGLFSPADQEPHSKGGRPRFKDEPLNHRAWALQEWHLSPRRLLFTSYDAIFDCLQGKKQDFGYVVYTHRLLPTSILNQRDWELLVMNYSSRELTNPGDKFAAIAGLAERFNKSSNGRNGRYLFALWEAHLPRSLLWHRNQFSGLMVPEPNSTMSTAYIAPSWSWASINGPIEFVNIRYGKEDLDVVAQVVSVDYHPAVEHDPPGPMVYRLGIRSRMKPLQKDTLTELHGASTSRVNKEITDLVLNPEGSPSDAPLTVSIYGDHAMRPFIEGPRALKFCAVMTDQRANWVWGLLLLEVDHTNFQRIGCGWCLRTWFEDAVEDFAEIT